MNAILSRVWLGVKYAFGFTGHALGGAVKEVRVVVAVEDLAEAVDLVGVLYDLFPNLRGKLVVTPELCPED